MFNYKMVFIFLFINTSQVNAVALTGDTMGFFTDKTTGIATLTETIKWGSYKSILDPQSSLSYEGAAFDGVKENTEFKIGTLIYDNTVIYDTTSFAEYVSDNRLGNSFEVRLDFSAPSKSGGFVFNYDLSVIETDNSLPDSADRVSLIPAEGFNPSFLIGGTEFYFELLGFKKDEKVYDNFFVQQENSKSPVNLYAKISAVPVPSAVWLFITALSGFFLMGKRRAV